MENNDVTRRQFGTEHRTDSSNLRDLLRFNQDDSNQTDQTFGADFNLSKRGGGGLDRIQSGRTLHDIIRDDNKESIHSKKSSKSFKDNYIRRQGSGSEWVSSVPTPASDVPIHPQNSFRNITRWDSTRKTDGSDPPNSESGTQRSKSIMLQRNVTIDRPRVRFEGLDDESEEEDNTEKEENENDKETGNGFEGEDGDGGGDGKEAPVRMSLMALLAETDEKDGLAYVTEEEDDEDEDEEEGGGEYTNCCVCMVRHKGTAFTPCGHTFCRLCSKELWVQRGNCPLCNNFILEILDIF